MSYKATSMIGTEFKIDLGGTPLLLEGLINLTAPAGTRPVSEWTPIQSTTKKYKTGRPTYGAASGKLAWSPIDPSHIKLLALYNSAAAANFELTEVDNGAQSLQWPGFVSQFGLTFPNEGVVEVAFGIQITGAHTTAAATSVTPSATFDPAVSQGTVGSLWVTSAYVAVKGATNFALAGGSRDTYPATPIDAAVASVMPGYIGQNKLTFDLLYDSTESTHVALLASYVGSTPINDKFKIATTQSSKVLINDPVVIDGWAWPTAPGANIVKVSATVNSTIAVS